MKNLKIPGIPIVYHDIHRGVTAALALSFLATLLFSSTVVAAEKAVKNANQTSTSEKGTLYEQDSKLLGKCDLLVSRSGIRMEMKKKDLVLIACPPTWEIIIFNRGEHKFFRSTAGNFHPPTSCTVALYRPGDTSQLRASTTEDTTVLGVKAKKVHMLGDSNVPGPNRTWQKLLINSGEYWLQTTNKAPAHVLRSIQQMYALPYGDGLPLQLVTTSNKGKLSKELTLEKVSEQPVIASQLKLPPGYAAVKKQEDLLMDRNTDNFIDLFPGP
jgi:hypothetical protein